MNRRTLCIAIIAGLASAGCAYLPSHGPGGGHDRYGGHRPFVEQAKVNCDANGPCKIPVEVLSATSNGVTQTWIVAPDATIAKGSHGVAIHWQLTNPGYSFRGDSIAFYEAKSTKQFSGPGVGEKGDEFHFTDANSDTHGYGYQIKVYNRETGDWLTLDPIIWNNN